MRTSIVSFVCNINTKQIIPLDNKFNIGEMNNVYFLNNGNAINFIAPQKHGKMISPYIHLTNAGLLNCLTLPQNASYNKIMEMTPQEEINLIQMFHDWIPEKNRNYKFLQNLNDWLG